LQPFAATHAGTFLIKELKTFGYTLQEWSRA